MYPGRVTDRDVCLGWIHGGSIRAEFMESVLTLLDTTDLVGRYVTFSAGTHLAAARNAIAGMFLDGGPETWLWMVDTDIAFSPDVLIRLLASADEIRPVMSGLYWTTTQGGLPLVPMLYDRAPDADREFTPCSGWHPGDVIRIGGCGAGCLLAHRGVLAAIRRDAGGAPCWFDEIRNGRCLYGEDLSFCLRAAAAGFPLHADTGAQAGHVKPVILGVTG